MLINIDDRLSGKERREKLKLLPLIYAFEHFNRNADVANFLGISVRSLSKYLNKYSELDCYRCRNRYKEKKDIGYYDMLKRYPNE